MKSNLIDIRASSIKSDDGNDKIILIPTFLVEPKDKKFVPQVVSCWCYSDSMLGQNLRFALVGNIMPGDHFCDVEGLGVFDVAYKYDKNKKLQRLTYCKVVE